MPTHHQLPLPGEDVKAFEQDLPGATTAAFNTTEIRPLPTETSLTMNGSWGFNITNRDFKSVKQLVTTLVRAAGTGTNLLLNIGPRPDETISPEFVQRLDSVGRWLDRHGQSIYGTRVGPITPRQWAVSTRKGDTTYVHVLSWSDRTLAIPALGAKVKRAGALASGSEVTFVQTDAGITLTLPPHNAADIDQVIVLQTGR